MFIVKKSNKKLILLILIAFLGLTILLVSAFLFARAELPQISVVFLTLLLILAYKLLLQYTKWKFSYLLIKDSFLEYYSRFSLFKESVISIDFVNIKDVSYYQNGLLNILTNSGIIILQTDSGEFRFHDTRSVKDAYSNIKDAVSNKSS